MVVNRSEVCQSNHAHRNITNPPTLTSISARSCPLRLEISISSLLLLPAASASMSSSATVVCSSKAVFTGLWSLLVTSSQHSNDNNCKLSDDIGNEEGKRW